MIKRRLYEFHRLLVLWFVCAGLSTPPSAAASWLHNAREAAMSGRRAWQPQLLVLAVAVLACSVCTPALAAGLSDDERVNLAPSADLINGNDDLDVANGEQGRSCVHVQGRNLGAWEGAGASCVSQHTSRDQGRRHDAWAKQRPLVYPGYPQTGNEPNQHSKHATLAGVCHSSGCCCIVCMRCR
jgi:hypothetical protein